MGAVAEAEADGQDIANLVSQAKIQKRWVEEIKFYETKAKQWEEKGKKILRRYKDDRSPRDQRTPRFNILWSNIQTLKPALYSRTPKPDIERRFRDKDDLGRISSTVLERSISYFINEQFDGAIECAVIDRLLPGRGTVWVRYEPHFKDAEYDENEEVADEGLEITDDVSTYGSGEEQQDGDGYKPFADEAAQEVEDEVICFDYVHWQDFGHTFGRTWAEVDAIWRKVYMTRDELKERFGEEIGKDITLDYSPHDLKDSKEENIEKKATIYEIWCKSDKTVYWIHKDHEKGPLDTQDDPLELSDFYPCPKPLFATLANDECIPVPDYIEYQDQAAELDEITSRIGAITKNIKVAGVYDASAEGIERLLAEGVENTLVPVKQYAALKEKGGLANVYDLMPMQDILQTLLGLYEARDKVKADLYEITGISDILRGASDANETAMAQQIKSQFGTMRLAAMQDDVQRFVRDLIKIGTQIIAEHFSIETIKKICGVELLSQQEKQLVQVRMQALQQYASQQSQLSPPNSPNQAASLSGPPAIPQRLPPLPALSPSLQKMDQEDIQEAMDNPSWEEVDALLKNEVSLSYKIDIETDSTIKYDQDAERDARVQFLTASGGFLREAMQNTNPDLAPLLAKMLMFGVRGFKVGKELESAFELAIHKLEKDAKNPQQKPDPEMMKVQAQMQLDREKMQTDAALRQQDQQADAALVQMKSQAEDKRLQMQAQVDAHQGQVDAEVEKFKIQLQGQLDMEKSRMDNETKIAVAQIQAKATLQNTQLSKTMDGSMAVDGEGNAQSMPTTVDLLNTVMSQLQKAFSDNTAQVMQSHQALMNTMMREKKIIRDQHGNIVGVQ